VRPFHCGIPIGIPADRDLPDHSNVARQARRAAGVEPRVHQVLVRFHRDHMVCQPGEGLDRPVPGHRCGDGDRHVGNVPQPGRVDLEILARPVDEVTGEEFADDLDRFTKHVLPAPDGRPSFTDDMFVGFSPLPRPSVKRPSARICKVAACCATTAGWYRIVGQLT